MHVFVGHSRNCVRVFATLSVSSAFHVRRRSCGADRRQPQHLGCRPYNASPARTSRIPHGSGSSDVRASAGCSSRPSRGCTPVRKGEAWLDPTGHPVVVPCDCVPGVCVRGECRLLTQGSTNAAAPTYTHCYMATHAEHGVVSVTARAAATPCRPPFPVFPLFKQAVGLRSSQPSSFFVFLGRTAGSAAYRVHSQTMPPLSYALLIWTYR